MENLTPIIAILFVVAAIISQNHANQQFAVTPNTHKVLEEKYCEDYSPCTEKQVCGANHKTYANNCEACKYTEWYTEGRCT